jgi:hypothetical protein
MTSRRISHRDGVKTLPEVRELQARKSSPHYFFDLLRQHGIDQSNVHTYVSLLKKAQVIDFGERAFEALGFTNDASLTKFTFSANSSLSGDVRVCIEASCRVRRLDSAARFAAMYADRLFIENPFMPYHLSDDFRQLRLSSVQSKMIGDIKALLYIRPLLENGIIDIRPDYYSECYFHTEAATDANDQLDQELAVVRDILRDEYAKVASVSLRRFDKRDYLVNIVQSDPDSEHHAGGYLLPASRLKELGIQSAKVQEMSGPEAARLGLFDPILSVPLTDIFGQAVLERYMPMQYLTDRKVDLLIASVIGKPEIARINDVMLEGLSHALPVASNTSIESLLRLRLQEGEAFAVYRDNLYKIIQKCETATRDEAIEMIEDVIRPEINNINQLIKSSRKLLGASLRNEVLVTSAALAIGLSSGALSASGAAILAAVGGVRSLSSIADKVFHRLDTPIEVKRNPYYFLWKIRDDVKS